MKLLLRSAVLAAVCLLGSSTVYASPPPAPVANFYRQLSTRTSLTAPKSAPASTAVTVVATVNQSVTGNIEFIEDGKTIATVAVANSSASLVTSALTVGNHTLRALYEGDVTHRGSISPAKIITITIPKLVISTPALPSAQVGTAFAAQLAATGGTPGYTWSLVSGRLPDGLTLSSSGLISGTPTTAASYTVSVRVTDSGSPAQANVLSLSIVVSPSAPPPPPTLLLDSPTFADGQVGSAYSYTLTAQGGTSPYTWAVTGGALPSGVALSRGGVVFGTPTASGTFAVSITVNDNGSPIQSATASASFTVAPASTPPPPPPPPPPGSAKLYVFPQAPIAVRGSYQSVTAIVNGVSDKTVKWSTDGGTIVGTNPCVVNEPCTVALYSATPGTYHLTATSNADNTTAATSTITLTAPSVQRTDHPRLLITSDTLPALQAKAIPSNLTYQAVKNLGTIYYTSDAKTWTFSTWNGTSCVGGSGPSSDQSANYKEVDSFWITAVSLLDQSSSTRDQYGCAARDIFLTNIGYVLNGQINLMQGNRWADGAESWSFVADWLLGGGYLSASDQTTVRAYLAKLAYDQINDIYNGGLAVIGGYNSPSQLLESDENSATIMRSMGNNYTHARILILTSAALTFNDNTTDDPPLSNTCNATRYQVCPDGTAGSLHAYWTYVSGGMLYKDWANLEDASVVQPAYNAAFNNLSSQPSCNTLWHTAVPCFGQGRGGESNEGTSYGSSTEKLRWALNAIHTAGYDDPLLYGPQLSISTMSYWDLRYVADLTLEAGLSGISTEKSRWNLLTDGDTLYYFAYPSDYGTESALLAADSYVGRTDRSAPLQWLVENSAFGGATGQTGGCIFYCGLDRELGNDYGSGVAVDLFLSLPAEDPAVSVPADPRPSLPTDWYAAGNQHIVVRDGGWTTGANTIFSYYCTNTQIDHEHQFCGGFDLYSNGEYITKGRTEFNDYNDEFSTARNKNTLDLIQYPGQTWCTSNPWCSFNQATTDGGQFWHGYQAGWSTLYHAELPSYVAAIAEDTNAYNGGWGGYGNFNGITAASRSLIYFRGLNQLITYDRGDTGSNAWDKSDYLVVTGKPTLAGNTASWPTRSGSQTVSWTAIEPVNLAPVLDEVYTDADTSNDWEIYGRVRIDAGSVPSARLLTVLQWGPSGGSPASFTRVSSSAGNTFEGVLSGSSLVLFMHDWPAAFTGVTYPASGAAKQYVSDLTPNTTYSIAASGAPATGTTDSAGVLVFSSDGTGSITVKP